MESNQGGLPGLEKDIQKNILSFILSPLTGAFVQKERSCPPEKTCPPEQPCPPESFIEISIQDKTTKNRFQGTDLFDMAEAMNRLTESYRQYWDTGKYKCKVYPKDTIPKTKYNVFLIDDLDVEGAYGYHDFSNDMFIINVGVETVLKDPANGLLQRKSMNGRSVSDVVAHEILETIANPYVNREIFTEYLHVYEIVNPNNQQIVDKVGFFKQFPSLFNVMLENGSEKKGTELTSNDKIVQVYINASVRAEVVNPVQGNKVDEVVNGKKIEIADFITPEWFQLNSKGPYNYKKTLQKPFDIDVGGYVDFILRNINGLPRIVQLYIHRVE